jgi:hypothetical protein
MKPDYAAVETISIYDFAKLDLSSQCKTIKQMGIFLESYTETERLVKLYYVCGFFVEVLVSQPQLQNVEIIPFKNGYKIEHYKEILFRDFTPLRSVA